MDTIKEIQNDALVLTKPAEDFTLTRREIKEKIQFLKTDIDNLQLALDGRKTDIAYYRDLLAQMPKEVVAPDSNFI